MARGITFLGTSRINDCHDHISAAAPTGLLQQFGCSLPIYRGDVGGRGGQATIDLGIAIVGGDLWLG